MHLSLILFFLFKHCEYLITTGPVHALHSNMVCVCEKSANKQYCNFH